MVEAINHAHGQWGALTLVLIDPHLPIDDSASERALRVAAMGRESFPFVGTDHAGENLAGLHSLVATCEAKDVILDAEVAKRSPRVMATVFLEVVLVARDMQAHGLLSRDEVEDPLSAALEDASLGEVAGGGGGSGVYVIDVEVSEEHFEEALSEMRAALRATTAPPSTEVRRHGPPETTYRLDKTVQIKLSVAGRSRRDQAR